MISHCNNKNWGPLNMVWLIYNYKMNYDVCVSIEF